jgi:hypothetical protein
MKTSKVISDAFKPEAKLVKSSMNGRLFYEDVNYTFLTGAMMKRIGEKLAKEFPEFEIWVTGGPYRGYDVKYQVDWKQKIISLDFYSVRPGIDYLNGIIEEIKQQMKKQEVKHSEYSVPEWLGMTKEEFTKKAKAGTCIVCGKVAINEHHNLCKGHHSAYHRWENKMRKKESKTK